MESKRLILAVVLSIAVFLGWNYLSLQMGWIPKAPDPAVQSEAPKVDPAGDASGADPTSQAPSAPSGDPSAVPQITAFTPMEGRLVTVETPLYKAVFHSSGGILREFQLLAYRTSIQEGAPQVNLVNQTAAAQAPMGLLLDGLPTWTGVPWALEGDNLVLDENGQGTLRFVAEINGVRLTRELLFSGDNYSIREKLRLSSVETRALKIGFTFGAGPLAVDERPSIFSRLRHTLFGGEPPVPSESQYNLTRVAWYQKGSFDEEHSTNDLGKGKLVQGNVSWMAVMNNYFMGAVSMNDEGATAKGRYFDGVYHVVIGKTGITVAKDNDAIVECAYFLGPKEAKKLSEAPNHMDKALDYGFFSIIARPLVFLLDFFYGFVHNYGVAIILMTVLIKLLFWPLSQKSYRSMQQMKQLQPMMMKIREKYAGDKESMNREIMQLYKTYKVNPAGGCLPILVQIPVFFGLYQALLNAIELRHAVFVPTLPFTELVWLADLAAPDPYCITPLVMGASMLLQQKMTPAPGDPTQAKLMMFMPIIFTVLFLGFPSGLVVYWLVNNIISIGQQWWQMRRKPV
ncbi:membrane protein insertase YidC [Desulfovibrio sp. OttesenSCG-928-A18]|nr:membrane protein insertase YidC [Desulfovibrio sp. OttesenSCG-928-A18]